MHIQYLSRVQFIKLITGPHRENTAFISINDSSEHFMAMENLMCDMGYSAGRDYATYVFHDVDEDHGGISDIQAKSLKAFIDHNKDKHFVVHCLLGVSRSAAVARFINEYLGRNLPEIEQYGLYNRRVYRKLMAEAGDSFEAYKAYLSDLEASERFSETRAKDMSFQGASVHARVIKRAHEK